MIAETRGSQLQHRRDRWVGGTLTAQRLRCTDAPEVETPLPGVHAQHWRHCADGARLAWMRIGGLGHHWSGARPMPFPAFVLGPQRAEPALGELVWQFLAAPTR